MKAFRFLPASIKLAENDGLISQAVQVIRTGTFKHPEYGAFNITKEHLDSFVKNFAENVRGIDIAVDYKHESDAEAAGWFKNLEVRELEKPGEFGLFADVEWTKPAKEVLANKEFRYLSADFTLSYKDSETQKEFGPVLLGAGLTNRPFIKGMDAIVKLSEIEIEGEKSMTLEQALAKIAELEAKLAAMNGGGQEFMDMKKQFTEVQAKLAEAEKKIADSEKEKKLAEKKGSFDKLLTEKKVVEAQREAFMADDFAKFAELSAPAPKDKKLSEDGGEDKGGNEDAEEKVLKLAEEVATKEKIGLEKALSKVLADPENKVLREEYEKKFN